MARADEPLAQVLAAVEAGDGAGRLLEPGLPAFRVSVAPAGPPSTRAPDRARPRLGGVARAAHPRRATGAAHPSADDVQWPGKDTMAVTLAKRAFTLDEYHRMVQAGILAESDRVELIRGEIVVMAPIGRRHAGQVGSPHPAVLPGSGRAGHRVGPEPAPPWPRL